VKPPKVLSAKADRRIATKVLERDAAGAGLCVSRLIRDKPGR
jgi:hypothetical protein